MSIDCSDRKKVRDKVPNDRKGIDRRDVLLSGGSVFASSALGEAFVTATNKPANAQARVAMPAALPSHRRTFNAR